MNPQERTFEIVMQECMDALETITEIFKKAGEQ